MSFGLEVFDQSGMKKLGISSRLARVVNKMVVSITPGQRTTVVVPYAGMAPSTWIGFSQLGNVVNINTDSYTLVTSGSNFSSDTIYILRY